MTYISELSAVLKTSPPGTVVWRFVHVNGLDWATLRKHNGRYRLYRPGITFWVAVADVERCRRAFLAELERWQPARAD